jgi:hypothetical protein
MSLRVVGGPNALTTEFSNHQSVVTARPLVAVLLSQRLPWSVFTQIALTGVHERVAGLAHREMVGHLDQPVPSRKSILTASPGDPVLFEIDCLEGRRHLSVLRVRRAA